MSLQTIEMVQSFVMQHKDLFMTLSPRGYELDYENACKFRIWSCFIEIYSSIAFDN